MRQILATIAGLEAESLGNGLQKIIRYGTVNHMGLFSKRTKSVGQAQSLSPSDTSTPSGAQLLNPALIAEAKTQPGGWVYQIELPAGADPNGAIPGSAVKGGWKVNDDGDITGDFIPNPNFVKP